MAIAMFFSLMEGTLKVGGQHHLIDHISTAA